jgi:hypothetical protein
MYGVSFTPAEHGCAWVPCQPTKVFVRLTRVDGENRLAGLSLADKAREDTEAPEERSV